MTRENYRDMRAGVLTNVIIPLLQGREYTLHLYGTVSKPYAPRCHVTLPTGTDVPAKIMDKGLNRLRHAIAAHGANAGVYTFSCSMVYTDAIEGSSHTLVLEKSINITFIRGTNQLGMLNHDRGVPLQVVTMLEVAFQGHF